MAEGVSAGATTADLAMALASAATTRSLYPAAHPRNQRALERLDLAYAAILEGRTETTVLIVDGELVIDGERVGAAALHGQGLTRALARFGVERLSVRAGVDRDELEGLLAGLAGEHTLLGSPHVVLGRLFLSEGGTGETEDGPGRRAVGPSGGLDEVAIDGLGGGFARLRTDLAGSFADLDRRLWHVVEASARESPSLVLLGELRGFEDRLFRHSVTVSLWTLAFARALGVPQETQHDLAMAGLLHDVGLLEFPSELVFGATRSGEERLRLRKHPELGALKLCASREMPALPMVVALEHHLRADGGPGGYPDLGRKPSLAARIVAVVDTWEMLFSATVGRPHATRSKWVAQVLRHRATSGILDPELVELFLQLDTAEDQSNPNADQSNPRTPP